MHSGERYAGGLSLDFFPSAAFEEGKPGDTPENHAIQARNLLRILMAGWNEKWSSLLTWRTLKAVFISRDHQLTQAMRLAFQQGFNHIFSQLDGKSLSQLEHNQALLFINNCLSYLPFADITPYESLAIPQYVDGTWQMIDYKVTPIELTPTTGFKKLFLNDYDRVFAYGLEPLNHTNAEPHLIFMGTTYPAGQGFATTVNTDLEPFETAGKKLYRTGHQNITRWLDQQYPKKTHVCGTSLGGALSLLLAIDQGDKLSRVDALNPPGLYHPWRKSRFDHWDDLRSKPEVYIQKQGRDPVSCLGVWKPDWNVLHVIPPADKQGPNQVTDHALNYAGFPDTQFIGVDTNEDNKERRTRNLWLYTLGRSVGYYCGMVPYRYFLLPVLRFALEHKLQLSIILPAVALFYLLPPLIPTIILAIATIPLVGAVLNKINTIVLTLLGNNSQKPPKYQHPTLPRNKSMDIYTNSMEVTFTYKELGDYYFAKRCLLKNKPFIATGEPVSSKLFKTTGQSKHAVLLKSREQESHNTEITFFATKAKVHHIQHTVRLIRQFGFHREDELRVELEPGHRAYLTGKLL